MFENIYIGSKAKEEETKVQYMIKELYLYLINNHNDIFDDVRDNLPRENIHRIVCDYIAGMTDRYAINRFKSIFLPLSWQYI